MKIISRTGISAAAVILLITSSCVMDLLCVDGNGIPGTESRDDHDFTGIANATDADLIYTVGDNYSVSVEADQNLLKYYKTSVSGNCLEIETERNTCVRSVNPPIIRVTAPSIDNFFLSGSGNMVGDNLSGTSVNITNSGSGNIIADYVEATNLKTKLSGSGDITIYDSNSYEVTVIISGSGNATLNGEAESGIFTSTGAGQNKSGALNLTTCNATLSGSGDVFTSVSQDLIASLSGSANLYYTGSPQVTQTITGSGRIIHLPK